MRTVFYHTRKERRQIVKDANAMGESVIHDDFLNDGLKRLTLDIKIAPHDPLIDLTKELLEKLKNDTITFAELKILLRIEHNLPLLQSTLERMKARITNFITR